MNPAPCTLRHGRSGVPTPAIPQAFSAVTGASLGPELQAQSMSVIASGIGFTARPPANVYGNQLPGGVVTALALIGEGVF